MQDASVSPGWFIVSAAVLRGLRTSACGHRLGLNLFDGIGSYEGSRPSRSWCFFFGVRAAMGRAIPEV